MSYIPSAGLYSVLENPLSSFFCFQLHISSYEKYSVCVNAFKGTEKKYLFNLGFNLFDFIYVKRQADITGIAQTCLHEC